MNREGADCAPLLRCTTDVVLNEVDPWRLLFPTRNNLQEHSKSADSLHILMLWLFDHFKEAGTMADLTLAITLGNAALRLRPPGNSSRDASLYALSRCLHARFEKLGIIGDLEEGISHARAALALRLRGHPERATSLYDVASDLYARFQNLGEISNLKEAITLGRDALDLHPLGHPERTASLNSLLTYIVAMFDQHGDRITDIEEAFSATRGVVEIYPPEERLDFLCRLASLLLSRFRSQHHFADLERASKLYQDILDLSSLGHPELASLLHDFALGLSERFDQQGVLDDLDRAIALTYSALDLRPRGDPDRAASLKSLATYRQKKIMEPRTEVAPKGIKRLIRDAIDATLETLPPRLLNTETGCLCGRDALVSDFESSEQYQELLWFADPCNGAHVRKSVSGYFRYVTLSHRWGRREPLLGEIKGHCIHTILDPTDGLVKLQQFCATACERGYMWAWSDTCCIDKDSSVELQEAIGSMYSWYQHSALTIVHLADVKDADSLSRSEWFQRGWTLQELLASKTIQFFTRNWSLYRGCVASNHKDDSTVLNELEEAAHIARDYLVDFHPGMDDARSRFQWASQRRTTRPEDMAYSLFGVFGVHLPILYGESKQKALARLLEEIISKSGDISVLDWVGEASSSHSCFPANIASYLTPLIPHKNSIQLSLPSTEQAESTKALRRLYGSLSKSELPQFIGRRLRLPCIMHRVTAVYLKPNSSAPEHLFEIRAKGLMSLEISLSVKLQDDVHSKLPYVLIRPWHPKLLFKSSSTDVAPAEQVMSILGEPFNALLLEELPLNEYRRIASSSAIYAYPADASSIFHSKVHTLNIV